MSPTTDRCTSTLPPKVRRPGLPGGREPREAMFRVDIRAARFPGRRTPRRRFARASSRSRSSCPSSSDSPRRPMRRGKSTMSWSCPRTSRRAPRACASSTRRETRSTRGTVRSASPGARSFAGAGRPGLDARRRDGELLARDTNPKCEELIDSLTFHQLGSLAVEIPISTEQSQSANDTLTRQRDHWGPDSRRRTTPRHRTRTGEPPDARDRFHEPARDARRARIARTSPRGSSIDRRDAS